MHTGSHGHVSLPLSAPPLRGRASPRYASPCIRTVCTSHARTLHRQLSPIANVRWYHSATIQYNPPLLNLPSRPSSLTAFNMLSGQVRARQSPNRTSAGCVLSLFLCPRLPVPFPGPHTCTPHPHVVHTPALLVNSPRAPFPFHFRFHCVECAP
ncbi:hypothetical protein B0H17DRAFT_1327567 [Mycena rosella]|uniref:Uncharacterized protein n=1 Tax=Mycena rosella TaxID=1033263 RepID=A0AAD7DYR1_MYCRO|nr:hypothetical protein B0H17DRAFT_1327567 [Mycena rosella]